MMPARIPTPRETASAMSVELSDTIVPPLLIIGVLPMSEGLLMSLNCKRSEEKFASSLVLELFTSKSLYNLYERMAIMN